ncbi:FecR domain-containing protein [Mucilaginibacter sp. UR6-1]|uniref:FecR family protein n=1 Tax=Mucilaginibacter sp. UR6-1 TaxID=1435643 RepID=UPI001E49F99D|nr:FecR family protein [Mucilaginibacter sp. UR6-1]MCC8407563.1 FecR domain-containing protein [Mucilaginibacter sp. UR6-1]
MIAVNWEILIKYLNKETTVAESAEVETWLTQRPENKMLLQHLQERSRKANEPVKSDEIHNEWVKLLDRMYADPKRVKQTKVTRLYTWAGVAASLVLVCCFTWYSLQRKKEVYENNYTLIKKSPLRKKVALPDGSLVYLAPEASLEVSNAYGQAKREVRLSGEAFFDVKHDVKRSFIVRTANNLQVNVLGTSFNVYSHKGLSEEIKVATGLVGFVEGKHTHFVKAGEQLNYNVAAKAAQKQTVNIQEAESLLNGTLYFSKSNATQIADKLEQYYHIKVEVKPSANKKYSLFSGEMQDNGLDKLLEGLNYATGIHYKYKNPQTIIFY